MKISSIFIGNELLNGQTTNLNLIHLGSELKKAGYLLSSSINIPDLLELISSSLKTLLSQSDVVLICGGLGPTADDITREAVAQAMGMKTVHSEEVDKFLRSYMALKKRQPKEEYFTRQAQVIEQAGIIKNRVGLAPGLHIKTEDKDVFLLPGPPREFNPMLTLDVLPYLKKKYPASYQSDLFHIYGIPESVVEQKFQPILQKYPFILPAYCANLGLVKLTIAYSGDHLQKQILIHSDIFKEFGHHISKNGQLVDDIAELILPKSWSLATAESCTGGWIGQAITAYPGASDFFQGSINTYANDWKINHLGVRPKTLETVGAVSEECAVEMVNGLCLRYKVSCGIAVTGIAGPGGGSREKPVGLVFIATKTPKGLIVHKRLFGGERKEVREQTVRYALNQLRLQLLED